MIEWYVLFALLLGWQYRNCREGINIFTSNDTNLIALVKNEEECEAICKAIDECSLAVWDTNASRKLNRCIPRKDFNGHCDRPNYFTKRIKGYVKDLTGNMQFQVRYIFAKVNNLYV